MRILSVNTGEIELLPEGKSKTKTGIYKYPRKGSVHVGETHLEGDHIANKKHHGGPDQAVYLYSAEDYAWWEKELDSELPFGTFGENLTVASFDGRQPRVGDIWHFEQVVLQMTAPRIPCSKLAARMEDPAFLKRFVQVNRGGAYARVLHTGPVAAGEQGRLEPAPEGAPYIDEIFALWHSSPKDVELMRRALQHPLAERARTVPEMWLSKESATRNS